MAQKPSRVVVITGASAGVGRAVAREFSRREGARIALIARGPKGLDGARQEVESVGGEALVLPLDIADARALDAAAEEVERQLGPIDVWINNAMTSVFSHVIDMRPEEYERVTQVTYLGTVYGTLSALRRMQRHGGGRIIQVGSALSYRSIPLQSAYCAAKHAVQGFTEALRCELMHERSPIRLSMVHLPALNTPQFGWVKSRMPKKAQPVPPIYQPEVAARAIYWASKHYRRELFVGAPTYKTIWGNKIAPWYADRVLARSGISDQQTPEAERADRPHNLWEPVDIDAGAHGAFSEDAREASPLLRLTLHRRWLAMASLSVAGLLAYRRLKAA